MSNEEKKKQIRLSLEANDKTRKWLKGKLKRKGFDVDIYYVLGENSKGLDNQLVETIELIFREEGIITSDHERYHKLDDHLIKLSNILSNSLTMVHDSAKDLFEDDFRYSFDDKRKIVDKIDSIEEEMTIRIDDLRKVFTR